MAKRRLSGQQTARIRDSQHRRAVRAADNGAAEGPELRGLVIAHFGRQLDVEALDGPAAGSMLRCHVRANLGALVTGDQVVWCPQPSADDAPGGVVVAALPRHSLLARPASHSGEPRPVAANVDRIAVVIAPQPEPFANLIDRYLVAAEALDIQPLLVLNKTDLLPAAGDTGINTLLNRYRAIGYPVYSVAARSGSGLEQLAAALQGHTSVLVGQSGVGKSSLIAALLPGVDVRVGALSEAEAKGRHTTTTARLFHLPGGGDLIDSPGIREFGLGHLERADVEAGFIEFRPFLGRCRFRDCRHRDEPDCALRDAAAQGLIDPARMTSYRAIVADQEQR